VKKVLFLFILGILQRHAHSQIAFIESHLGQKNTSLASDIQQAGFVAGANDDRVQIIFPQMPNSVWQSFAIVYDSQGTIYSGIIESSSFGSSDVIGVVSAYNWLDKARAEVAPSIGLPDFSDRKVFNRSAPIPIYKWRREKMFLEASIEKDDKNSYFGKISFILNKYLETITGKPIPPK